MNKFRYEYVQTNLSPRRHLWWSALGNALAHARVHVIPATSITTLQLPPPQNVRVCVCVCVYVCVCAPARVYAQLTHAKLVIAVLGDVSHPWQRLVPTLFHDLEIPHLPPFVCVSDSPERCRETTETLP